MKKVWEIAKETVILSFATLIIAAAVFFFLMPSNAAVSSISGLAIVLHQVLPLSVATISLILNVVLLIIGFITCGKEFGVKTVYTSILLPLIIGVFEKVFPENTSFTGDATLDVISYIFFVSIGLMILFNRNASSGGLDIVAKIMNKYLRMEIGKAMSLAGMCIALSSAFVFDKKVVVLSVLGTYFNGMILDHFIFGQNMKKRVCIITKKQKEVTDFILHTLHSGATLYEAKGAYNGDVHEEIIAIVDKEEYQKLMNYLLECDPQAFVTVYAVNEVIYQPKVVAKG